MRDVLRRSGWVLVFALGLPAIVVGLVTLHTFFAVPFVLLLGFTAARSDIRIFLSAGVLAGVALLIGVGLVVYADSQDWWFVAIVATSSLFATLATFKVGMMINLRAFGRPTSPKRGQV
jgi:hypothetical protein